MEDVQTTRSDRPSLTVQKPGKNSYSEEHKTGSLKLLGGSGGSYTDLEDFNNVALPQFRNARTGFQRIEQINFFLFNTKVLRFCGRPVQLTLGSKSFNAIIGCRFFKNIVRVGP